MGQRPRSTSDKAGLSLISTRLRWSYTHFGLAKAAEIVEASVDETLSYYNFPSEHWRSIRTNNPMERLNREIRRRTRMVGAFPDGYSALMLVAARLRHMAATKWRTKRYSSIRFSICTWR